MTKVVSNKKQLAKIVELMEANSDIAKGLVSKCVAKSRWQQFAIELNSLGPPSRDWEKWLRVWTDLKFKIKKKKTDNRVEINATGGGPNQLHNFSDLEDAVVNLLEIDTCLNPPGREFGLEEASHTIIENDDDAAIPRDNLEPTDQPNYQKKKNSTKKDQLNERVLLLKNQTSGQTKFYDDITSIMRNIKRSIHNIEDYSKKTYHLKKEKKEDILKIKNEKLRLYKEYIKNKENDRKVKLNLKIQILELEKLKYGQTE